MPTEIFIEPELEILETAEASAEWLQIATELGLHQQIATTSKSPERKAPPYQAIDPKTSRIIRTLCPCQIEYQKYSASTIPLDVLQEIAKCVKNNWYEQIYILYDDKSSDPFVAGVFKNNGAHNSHLIARWGGELLPFELLEKKAIDRLEVIAEEALQEMKSKIDYGVSNPKAFVAGMFNGRERPNLQFNIGEINVWGGSMFF